MCKSMATWVTLLSALTLCHVASSALHLEDRDPYSGDHFSNFLSDDDVTEDDEREQLIQESIEEFYRWKNSRARVLEKSEPAQTSARRSLRAGGRWTGSVAKFYGTEKGEGEGQEEEEPLDFSSITPASLKEAIRLNSLDQTEKTTLEEELTDITVYRMQLLSELSALHELRTSLEDMLRQRREEVGDPQKDKNGDRKRGWVERLLELSQWNNQQDYEGLPGVSILADESSYSCLLVVKDACNFQETSGASLWYSSQGLNLTKVVNDRDVCGQVERLRSQANHLGTEAPKHLRLKEQEGSTVKLTETVGRFLSTQEKDEILKKNNMKLQKPKTTVPRALAVSGCGDEIEVLREIGALAEVSNAIAEGLNVTFEEPIIDDLTVHFSFSEKRIRKDIPETVRVMTGWAATNTTDVMKAKEGHVCFDEVIFVLNRAFSRGRGVERMKRGSHSLVTNSYAPQLMQPPRAAPHYQITWLWHGGPHQIANLEDVQKLIFEVFKGTPIAVVNLEKSDNFIQMVDVMRRTALLVAMQGFSLLPLIFMPSGSSVVELLPMKHTGGRSKLVARESALHHFLWEASLLNSTTYRNNCFKQEWLNLSPSECEKRSECVTCIDSPSLTSVDTLELERVFKPVRAHLTQWINGQHPSTQ